MKNKQRIGSNVFGAQQVFPTFPSNPKRNCILLFLVLYHNFHHLPLRFIHYFQIINTGR